MRNLKWFEMIIIAALIIFAAIICIELISLTVKYHDFKSSTPVNTHKPPQKNPNPPPPSQVWGIDTASEINQSMYQCVSKNYGNPVFVGRYLGDNGDASSGVTKEEAKFLHSKKIKILPIHNHFTNATGMKNGQTEAKEAIKLAKELGVKNGVVLVADIEEKYKADADFLIGWTKTLLDNKFKPGVYGNFEKGDLKNAYAEATKKDNNVKVNLILWTNQPTDGVTGKDKAPKEFKGKSPNNDKTLVWQYGLEDKKCNIDSDLGKGNLLDLLW